MKFAKSLLLAALVNATMVSGALAQTQGKTVSPELARCRQDVVDYMEESGLAQFINHVEGFQAIPPFAHEKSVFANVKTPEEMKQFVSDYFAIRGFKVTDFSLPHLDATTNSLPQDYIIVVTARRDSERDNGEWAQEEPLSFTIDWPHLINQPTTSPNFPSIAEASSGSRDSGSWVSFAYRDQKYFVQPAMEEEKSLNDFAHTNIPSCSPEALKTPAPKLQGT